MRFSWCRFAYSFLLPTGGCAGSRPGRASHFHLSRQMKVTKAKAREHQLIWPSRFGYKGSLCHCHAWDKPHTCCDFFTTRLAAHRLNAHRADAKRGVDRESLRSKRPHCSWGPSEPSRSAGLCRGAQRLRPLTSGGCLNAAAAGRVVSSARPAKSEHRRAVGPGPNGEGGRLSFGSFSLAKQRKGTALSGAHPDAASRSEQDSH